MQHRKGVGDITWHRPPSSSPKRPRTPTAQAVQLGRAANELQRPPETAGCTGDVGRASAVDIAKPTYCYERHFADRAVVGWQQRHADGSE